MLQDTQDMGDRHLCTFYKWLRIQVVFQNQPLVITSDGNFSISNAYFPLV